MPEKKPVYEFPPCAQCGPVVDVLFKAVKRATVWCGCGDQIINNGLALCGECVEQAVLKAKYQAREEMDKVRFAKEAQLAYEISGDSATRERERCLDCVAAEAQVCGCSDRIAKRIRELK